MKICARPGCGRGFVPRSNRQRFCSPTCRLVAKATVNAGRYGRDHKRIRRVYRPLVESGTATCTRCRRPILPGDDWHLDHRDGGGPDEYAGPAHADCNSTAPHRRRSLADYARDPTFADRPEERIYYGPPHSDGGPPERWSRAWYDWRAEALAEELAA